MAIRRKPLTRLAQIYQQEKFAGGGLGSTVGKRFAEAIDPRQLFNQQGLLPMLLPALFKSYKATPSKSRQEVEQYKTIQSINAQVNVIRVDTKIIAKNTMVLPAMARDVNVIRKNLVKALKAVGIKPVNKSNEYFTNSAIREKQYEEQYKTEKGIGVTSSDSPSKVKEESGSFLGKLLKTLAVGLAGFALSGLFNTDVFAATADWFKNENNQAKIGNFINGIFNGIMNGFSVVGEWINNEKNQEKIGNFFSNIIDIITKSLSNIGDLGAVLMKEFDREDSAFRQSIAGIWKFIEEHPFVALGAAIVTLGGLMGPLVVALGLVTGVLPSAIAALGAFWGGLEAAKKLLNVKKDKQQELRLEHEQRLDEISKIQDPKLKKEIIDDIKTGSENRWELTKKIESKPEAVERYTELAYEKYKKDIERDKNNKLAEKVQEKTQPKPVKITGVDEPGTIPPAPTTTPTNVPSKTVNTPVTTPTPLSGTNNVEKVRKYLMSELGLNNEQAAGIIGNLQKESYADIRPTAENASGHYGIAQWSPERQKDFEKVMGKSIKGSSLEDQLAFMKYEMTQGNYKKALSNVKSSSGYAQATEAFHRDFEKSEQTNISDRIALAKNAIPTTPTTMESIDTSNVALNWKPGVNQNVNSDIKTKLQQLQAKYPNMVITSGGEKSGHVNNSQHYEGKAVDVRLAGASNEDRANFIRDASAAGFTGIGTYSSGLLHLDTRKNKMTWGDDYHKGSEPEWAKLAVAEHMSGKISPTPITEPGTQIASNQTPTTPAVSINPQQPSDLLTRLREIYRTNPQALNRPFNYDPKIDGGAINSLSSNFTDAARNMAPPNVTVVSPPPQKTAQNLPATDSKPQYNGDVLDHEFIKILVGRTVDYYA